MQIIKTALALTIIASLIMPMPSSLVSEKTGPLPPQEAQQALEVLSSGEIEIEYNKETGLARSIRTTLDNPIQQELNVLDLLQVDEPAQAFLHKIRLPVRDK